ncbi:PREDICTED: uncharacterized protein LOC107165144 isoform X2 [Diuraphis noxia]|uniref:uncharacterized protein LOC107165144 isoform X2 n=1 Tax=Diuraphis noxia TaxID=143948 RepID=UPI000763B88C|nr:PREDICTED: uncharacterized protein LOC107165144 isoform X2 [Diuraphis noxia]
MSIVKPIVLMHVAICSSLMIMLSNSFIMVFLSTGSFTYKTINLFKIGSGIVHLCGQLFLYCHLFDNMNLKINDANHVRMKVSTKKIVNLQLFASVLMTSYNIVSVMVKTMNK